MSKIIKLLLFMLALDLSAYAQQCCDRQATKETQNLFKNLYRLKGKGIFFGHQDDLAYGMGWKDVPGNSDVKISCGDYPSVYAWDFAGFDKDDNFNIDGVPFDKMRKYVQEGYRQGAFISFSWHSDNPLTKGNAWDTTHAVASILPGGDKHQIYKHWLDNVSEYVLTLRGERGELIPILFRPYHELTGNWFWWCKNTCTPNEFKRLWAFVFDYLTNKKGLHNLLWVYNPSGNFKNAAEFLEYYPGDGMVDMISFDYYQQDDPTKGAAYIREVGACIKIMEDIAAERKKLTALAETGYEDIPDPAWWTKTLWKAIGNTSISYVLLWRNHGPMEGRPRNHCYVPYEGNPSLADFKKFYALPNTWFAKEAKGLKLYDSRK